MFNILSRGYAIGLYTAIATVVASAFIGAYVATHVSIVHARVHIHLRSHSQRKKIVEAETCLTQACPAIAFV